MIVSHSRKFIFVHLHKCAGTSLTQALRPYLSSNDLVIAGSQRSGDVIAGDLAQLQSQLHKHSPAERISQALGDAVWNSYFSFAFVRHPLDRLVSLYEFFNRVLVNNPLLPDPANREPVCNIPDQPPWNWPGMRALLSTGDFAGFIRSEFLAREQGASRQTRSLTDKSGDLLVDFVGKVENIADDWPKICAQLGIKATLSVENRSARRFADLRKYWSREDLEFAARKYREDFELFGYSIDDIF